MKKIALCVITGLMVGACAPPEHTTTQAVVEKPLYLDTTATIDDRVANLVSRMTLEEKVSQMYNAAPAIPRLNIPAYDYWNEALHGVARAGKATVFPQAIGMAAMWDKDLMLDVATAISDEGRAKHHFFFDNNVHYRYTGLTFWSPNINIFRDPRWGRGQETYGEDPFLTGELAIPFIHGLQGDDDKYLKTAATAKHFAVHNGPEISRHSDNYVVSDQDLYETYLPAFEKAVVDADVEAVMCAYNRVNGLPACGSEQLLKDVLRGEYAFDGHVMSDCGAIADFYDPKAHNVVAAPAVAAAWAVATGTDLNCGTGRLSTFANLTYAVQEGLIDESLIDQAVTRLFKTRFKLGMFDPKADVAYANIPLSVVGSPAHLSLAEEASARSLVLLKNDGVLPLKGAPKIAVIGPNAINEDVLLGNYNGLPINPVNTLQGLKNAFGEDNVTFAPGSAIIADVYGHYTTVPADLFTSTNQAGIAVQGLQGHYFTVVKNAISDYTQLDSAYDFATTPSMIRTDANIDFYWERSPLDDKVMSEFGVKWHGTLTPKMSGDYQFNEVATVRINGEIVNGTVNLQAGKAYTFDAEQLFLRNPWNNTVPAIQLQWVNTSEPLLQQALATAKQADVIVVAAGISPRVEGEEMPVKLEGFNYGDRTDIDLPAEQQRLIKQLHTLGKPMVLVNFSGSAMALNWENNNLNAIVQAFYPGEATGTVLAQILKGERNPSGRLPITFYHGIEGFAAFDDYDMTNRTYRFFKDEVLYPFGYGLSYSHFTYSDLKSPNSITAGQDLSLSITLNNLSDMAGDEVTQVYVSMPDAPVRTPQVALKGFTRTTVSANGTQQVSITVPADELVYFNEQGEKVPYTGKLQVSVGSGQPAYTAETAKQTAVVVIQ